jgi:four helix bundle protein
MQDFKQLKVWQKGLDIAVQTYRFTSTLPKHEQFGLISQMTRAGVSIPSNIAEGCSRHSDKDKGRFAEIALGSCFELETQLSIAQKVYLGDQQLCRDLLEILTEEQKMLNAYVKSLNR